MIKSKNHYTTVFHKVDQQPTPQAKINQLKSTKFSPVLSAAI